MADVPNVLTVGDLGRKVKAKYPGAYDDLSDDDLGRKFKAKYPGSYDDFVDTPGGLSALAAPQQALIDAGSDWLRAGKDFVGGAGQLLGSLFATPKAALIHEIPDVANALVSLNKYASRMQEKAPAQAPLPPVKFSPTSDLEQMKALGMDDATAMGVSFLTDLPLTSGLNALGARFIAPLASQAIEPLRGLPGFKQAGEFVSTGASLPARFRQSAQRALRTAEGEADLSSYLRSKRLGDFGRLPIETQDKIQDAIERRGVFLLPPEEKRVAEALIAEYEDRVAQRVGTGLRRHELGADIEEKAGAALKAEDELRAQERFTRNLEGMQVDAPSIDWNPPASTRIVGPEDDITHIMERMRDAGTTRVPLPEGYLGPEQIIPRRSFGNMPESELGHSVRAMTGTPEVRGVSRDALKSGYTGTPTPAGSMVKKYRHEVLTPERESIERARNLLARREQETKDAILAFEEATRGAIGMPRSIQGKHLDIERSMDLIRGRDKSLVAFTDRPLPPEARAEMHRSKAFGTAIPGGLGTGNLGRRISNPAKLTSEINKEMVAEGKARIAPIVESAFEMGAANDRRVANAKIIKTLVDKYGIPIDPKRQAAESVAKKFESVSTGFDDKYRKVLESRKLPKELEEFVGRLNTRLSPEHYGKTGKFFRGISNEFKRYALFSPGFIERNFYNNAFQTVAFGNWNPVHFKDTWAPAIKVEYARNTGKHLDDLIRVGGKQMKVRDYLEDAIRRGVARGQTEVEIPKTGWKRPDAPAHRGFRWANDAQERASRMAFDLYQQNVRKLDPMKAAEKVDQVLFNYATRTASQARNRLRRTAYPFINWDSQVPQLVGVTATERPGTLGLYGATKAKINRLQGVSESDIADMGPDVERGGGIVTKAGPDSLKAVLPQLVGQQSFNELIPDFKSRGWRAGVDFLAQKSYPWQSVPLQIAMKRSSLTGQEWGGKQIPPPLPVPKAWEAVYLMTGGKETAAKWGFFVDEDGVLKAPAPIAISMQAIPHTKVPSILYELISPSKGSPERRASFLYGVREVERERGKGESITRSRLIAEINQIKKDIRKYPPEVAEQLIKQLEDRVEALP